MNEAATNAPLYRRVLGADFDRLPPAVHALHDLRESSVWTGSADVERGSSLICRLVAAVAGLPPAGCGQPLSVTFTPQNGAEVWHRTFGRSVFRTVQWMGDGVILEQAGPVRLTLVPKAAAVGISLELRNVHVFGVPVPRALHPVVTAREYETAGRFRFEVEARLPGLGRLVRYAGWLEPAARP